MRKKLLSFCLIIAFVFLSVSPVTAETNEFVSELLDNWTGDLTNVNFIEQWYMKHKGLSGEELQEYLEADYEYKIDFPEARFDDISGLPCEAAVKTLGKYGIVTGRSEGMFVPEASITRAEMVTILLRVFGGEDYTGDFKFADVPESHWGFNNIMKAYGMKMVAGTGDTTFSPDLPLTYEQAVKMLVSSLGKEGEAISLGGWPEGYIKEGELLGILGDTKPSDTSSEINRGTMAQLIANSVYFVEAAIDYVDPYQEVIRLKNTVYLNEIIDLDTPMMNVDRTLADFSSCNEWDTLSLIRRKSDNKHISSVKLDYNGGDWSLRNEEVWQWIKDEKLRQVWGFVLDDPDYVAETLVPLYESGINCAATTMIGGLDKFYNFKQLTAFLDTVDDVASEFPGLNINLVAQAGSGSNNTKYGRFHSGDESKYTKTPCPVSEEYWRVQCFEIFALAITHPSIKLINFDWEMYGADSTGFIGPCFCDECYKAFIENRVYETEDFADAEAIVRKQLILENELMDEYRWYQQERVVDLCQKYMKALHDINPDVIASYTPNFEWIPGMTRGLGTPEMPCIIMTENTYTGGLLDVTPAKENIKKQGIPASLCPGLWTEPVAPEDLPEKICQAAYQTDGFWSYSSGYMRKDHKFAQNADGKERTPELYLDAHKEGIGYIDDFLRTGEEIPPEQYEIWEYDVKFVSDKPTEKDWDDADFTCSFGKNRAGHAVSEVADTKAKMLWDGKRLYVRFYNYESYMSGLGAPVVGERDSWSWANQDVNEVFWKFMDVDNGMHIASNRGVCNIYDSYIPSVNVQSPAYNFDIIAESKDEEDKWIMDISVPLTTNGIRYPQSGEQMKVLLSRYRTHSSDSGSYCWGTVQGTFIDAMSLWGTVTLE